MGSASLSLVRPDRPTRGWKHYDEACQIFKALPTVELIARVGKTKAAEELNVTPTALGGRIKTLESLVRAKIFEGARSNRLTPVGKEIRKLWNQQFQERLAELLSSLERLHNENDLRISFDKSLWEAEGPALQEAFAARRPSAAIHPTFEEGQVTIENRIRDGVLDLGLVSFLGNEKIAPPVKRHFWRNEDMVLAIAPDRAKHLLNQIEVGPEHFRDLHDTLVTMPEDSRMYHSVGAYLRGLKIGKHFHYKIAAGDVNDALEKVSKDDGVSIIPAHAGADAEHLGTVALFLLKPKLQRSLEFLYLEDSLKKASILDFLECIRQRKKR